MYLSIVFRTSKPIELSAREQLKGIGGGSALEIEDLLHPYIIDTTDGLGDEDAVYRWHVHMSPIDYGRGTSIVDFMRSVIHALASVLQIDDVNWTAASGVIKISGGVAHPRELTSL